MIFMQRISGERNIQGKKTPKNRSASMAKMKRLAGLITTLLIFGPASSAQETAKPSAASPAATIARLEESRLIWSTARHNAFTDLLRHNQQWLCVFREGSAHIPGLDGAIRVISSPDGVKWESKALLTEKGVDLRDPKLSVTPDGRLMIVMGGSYYDGQEPTPSRKRTGSHSRVSFSKDGADWTAPAKVQGIEDNYWLWRVTWRKGVGYGTVYGAASAKGKRQFAVYRTTDGLKFDKPIQTEVPASGGEATVRFLPDDTMMILFRSEDKDRNAQIGVSKPPYEKWTWNNAGHPAQGPEFLRLADSRIFYAGRDFENGKAAKTVFGQLTPEKATPLLTLPSGGDTSYPGLVEAEPNVIWMSYYSSHEGKANIYLARIRLTPAP